MDPIKTFNSSSNSRCLCIKHHKDGLSRRHGRNPSRPLDQAQLSQTARVRILIAIDESGRAKKKKTTMERHLEDLRAPNRAAKATSAGAVLTSGSIQDCIEPDRPSAVARPRHSRPSALLQGWSLGDRRSHLHRRTHRAHTFLRRQRPVASAAGMAPAVVAT